MTDIKRKWDEIAKEGKLFDDHVREKIRKTPNPEMEKIRKEIVHGYFNDTKKCIDNILESEFDKIKEISKMLFEAFKNDKQLTLNSSYCTINLQVFEMNAKAISISRNSFFSRKEGKIWIGKIWIVSGFGSFSLTDLIMIFLGLRI
jgi:hypothetical protein